jgi:hypothetical protein
MSDTATRRVWQSARTLADLGHLTASWLEGDLATVPGYDGPPDEETAALVPMLAGLNRAGYVTSGSQPADAGHGYDGAWWEQRAAVEGFTGPHMAARLADAAETAELLAVVYAPAELPRWRIRYDRAVHVTRRDGEAVTWFGAHRPRRHLRDSWTGYGTCHPDAIKAVCGAWQVAVIDPLWRRRDLLWQVLADALASGGAR